MVEECDFRTTVDFGHRAVVRGDLRDVSVAEWWRAGTPLPDAKGRGGAAVLDLGPVQGVIRDFRRGGLLGFLCRRLYFDRCRPERELRVLTALIRAGVPVVRPVAALARRRWLVGHRLRLLTELVPDALPLPAFVAAEPGRRHTAVREAGRVVGLAFAAGLLHRDLHADNLIARVTGNSVDVRLLDLDRAVLRTPLDPAAVDRMLLRMVRYLHRHVGELEVRPTRADQVRFLAGAGQSRAERRVTWHRLAPLLAVELRRHGLA